MLACAGLAHLAWRAGLTAQTGFLREACARLRFVAPHDTLPAERPVLEPLAGPPHERLRFAGVAIDWWYPWGPNPNLKNWSGPQSARTVHRSLRSAAERSRPTGWLICAVPANGRLDLDPAGTWDAFGLGWSMKENRTVRMSCRRWVELLASSGLRAFPVPAHRARGGFHSNLWRPAALPSAIAAFAGPWSRAYALERYHVATGKTGSHTILRPAVPTTNGRWPPHGATRSKSRLRVGSSRFQCLRTGPTGIGRTDAPTSPAPRRLKAGSPQARLTAVPHRTALEPSAHRFRDPRRRGTTRPETRQCPPRGFVRWRSSQRPVCKHRKHVRRSTRKHVRRSAN